MPSVIIVSNRLPVSVKKVDGKLEFHASSGGLATGMSFLTNSPQGKWIGWPGIVSDDLTEDEKLTISKELAKKHCYPVFLTKRQVDGFYNRFSNSILWPFFHNLPTEFSEHEASWKIYRQVNQIFTDAVITLSKPKSSVWVHDYQLMLVPQMLRAERPHDSIGFFLHTPFPDALSFEGLPHGKSLLNGLLGSDLVGFHTTAYADNFLDSCHRTNVGIAQPGQVILADRTVRVTDFPISIDYLKFVEASKSPGVRREVKKLKRRYDNKKIILTVDRLDLTKGFIERLKAYREFLSTNEGLHGKVVMVMLAVPSRTEIKAYQNLKRQIDKLVREINQTFGTASWEPIDFMFKSVPFEELSALYQVADVAFVTPIRDGMNLVAKEYVASQANKNGVLILSQTAGAAQELTDAILVNPHKPHTLVSALSKALDMRPPELKKRVSRMQKHLANNTVHHWAHNFIHSLQTSTPAGIRTRRLNEKLSSGLLNNYKTATKRLLLFDYDGVLAELTQTHTDAAPTSTISELLGKLAADPANKVVVISGRGKADLDNWLGDVPVILAAEHGTVIKSGKTWRRIVESPRSWKQLIKPVFLKYAALTPGAEVEEKDTSLVWHYRKASPYFAQKHIVILRQILKPILKKHGLKLHGGNKILEIKSANINKGVAVQGWLRKYLEFIMAIGDDYTDEDMFMALPEHAYTIKVGRGKTAAKFRVDNVVAVQDIIEQLTRLST